MEGINNQDQGPVVENLETNVVPNQKQDIDVVSHETIGEDVLAKANEVLDKANENSAVLSETTQKKKGIFGRVLDFISGNAPLTPKEREEALAKVNSHPYAPEAYQQAISKGRGEEYLHAIKRKDTLAVSWDEKQNRYVGSSFSSK